MLFSQFDASEHAPLFSRVTADTNYRVNEMSRISVMQRYNYNFSLILMPNDAELRGKLTTIELELQLLHLKITNGMRANKAAK